MEIRQRNNIYDSVKFFCAVLVIFIHANYPYSHEVQPITHVAVPLFFCISGFFIYGKPNKASRLMRILRITIWSYVLYYLKTVVFQYVSTGNVYVPSAGDCLNFVLFNHVPFSIHLWYLVAYVYILLVAWVVNKYNKWKWAFACIIPMVLIGSYVKLAIGAEDYAENYFKWNNFMFLGFPYFFLGAFVRKYKEQFSAIISKRAILLLVAALSLVARYFVEYDFSLAFITDLDRFVLVTSLFLYFSGLNQARENVWSRLGKDYSLLIYILHLLVLGVLEMAAMKLPAQIHDIYMYVNPFVALFATIAVIYCLRKVGLNKYLE